MRSSDESCNSETSSVWGENGLKEQIRGVEEKSK